MIQWFAQEHPASCIAACLRMVLSSFGMTRTELEIRQLLGNPPYGLTLEEAAAKLLEAGAVAEWHTDWGWMIYATACVAAIIRLLASNDVTSVIPAQPTQSS